MGTKALTKDQIREMIRNNAMKVQMMQIESEYGSFEQFRASPARSPFRDPDYKYASVLRRITPDGVRFPNDADVILNDPAVAAYWSSVIGGKRPAFDEEANRVTNRLREIGKSDDPQEREMALDRNYAVKTLLPMYRAWGQMLLDAGLIKVADIRHSLMPSSNIR